MIEALLETLEKERKKRMELEEMLMHLLEPRTEVFDEAIESSARNPNTHVEWYPGEALKRLKADPINASYNYLCPSENLLT